MTLFIEVSAPDPEIWTDQKYLIKKDVITGLRLVKKLGQGGPDNALEVHTNENRSCRYWIRCPTFESAEKLYEELKNNLTS